MKPGDRLYVEKLDDKSDILSDFNKAAEAAGLSSKFRVVGQAVMKSSGRTVAKLMLSSHESVMDVLKTSQDDLDEAKKASSKQLLKVLAHLSGEGYKIR